MYTFASSVLAKPLNNAQIVRGVFCLYSIMVSQIPFTKPYTSSKELVSLLISRGLYINNCIEAEQYIRQYRLLQTFCIYVSIVAVT